MANPLASATLSNFWDEFAAPESYRSTLQELKGRIEGRIRYNEILENILKNSERDDFERSQDYMRAIGRNEIKVTHALVQLVPPESLLSGVQRDMEILRTTLRCILDVAQGSGDFKSNLLLLAMDIHSTHSLLKDEDDKFGARSVDPSKVRQDTEYPCYKKVNDLAKNIPLPGLYRFMEDKLLVLSQRIGFHYLPEYDPAIEKIARCALMLDQLLPSSANKKFTKKKKTELDELIKTLDAISLHMLEIDTNFCFLHDWNSYDSKRHYFDGKFLLSLENEQRKRNLESQLEELKASIERRLANDRQKTIASFAVSVLSEDTAPVAEPRRHEEQRDVLIQKMSSILSPDSTVSPVAEVLASLEPVEGLVFSSEASSALLATPDPETEVTETGIVESEPDLLQEYFASFKKKKKSGKNKKVQIDPKIDTAEGTQPEICKTVGNIDKKFDRWMSSIKTAAADYDETIKNFSRFLKATVEEENNQITIVFPDTNGQNTYVYFHKPHGAQLKKDKKASWFLNVIAGLKVARYLIS